MSTPTVPYITTADAVVGEGHPTLDDVANRPLKRVVALSGIPESLTGFTGFLGVFNVKAFGATGDGTTDDTAAIQDAITSAGVAGGGTVFLPRGTYSVTGTLTLDANNVVLAGEGDALTTIKVATGAPFFQNVISSTGRTNIGVRDLKVDANSLARVATIGTANVTCGLFLSQSTDLRISRVTVRDVIGGSSGSGVGIAIGGTPNVRVTVEHCKVITCGQSGRNADGIYMGGCEQGLITGCVARSVLDTCFVLESCNYSGIVGCTAYNCGLGAAISAAGGVEQVGNYIAGLAVYEWNSVNTGGLELVTIGTGSQLSDTLVSSVTMKHSAGLGPAVKVWQGSGNGSIVGLTLSGIRVNGSASQGILVMNAQDVLVAGCSVRNADGIGIQVDTGCSDVLVQNCRVTMKNGVTVGMATNGGTLSDVVFQGNKVTAGTGASYGIYHFGTATNVVDLFNVVRGTVSIAKIGSDAGTVPVVVGHDDTSDGGITLGKAAKRLFSWNAAVPALTIDPDSVGLQWGATSRLKASGGYRNTFDGWTAASTPASQTNVALTRTGGDWTALRAGSLTAVALRLSANAAGGVASATVFKNGVSTGLIATISVGSSFGSQTSAAGTINFVAGDILSIRITTAAGYSSTTAIPFASFDVET
jgi:hypothetical protein